MSKAARQTILSTLFSYIGVGLGAFYTIFIIPKLFHEYPENYGALNFLMNYAGLFLILSSLATPLSIIKFYPLYAKEKRANMLSFLFWINAIGLVISFLIFYWYEKEHPVSVYIEGKSVVISWFFYPILLSLTFFSFFESYCHALLKIAIPAFLNNTFTRLWLFVILLLYYYDIIGFEAFTYLYFGQFIASFFLLCLFVWKNKKDHFHFHFRTPDNYKEILRYSLFALPATSAAVLIAKIDIQMIGNILGTEQIAYYSYAIFFMTVLLIPKNVLLQTSRSIISRDFQTKSFDTFLPKYTKISFAFLLTTLTLFISIGININELMHILGTKFGSDAVKYAILILGVGRVIEAALVSNHAVLEYSKYYKMILVFETVALIILILLNFIFIPMYGIVGAAASSAFIFILNATVKSIFIYKKLRLVPLQKKHLSIILCTLCLGFLYFIPCHNLLLFTHETLNQVAIICIRSFLFLLGMWGIIAHFELRKLYGSISAKKDKTDTSQL